MADIVVSITTALLATIGSIFGASMAFSKQMTLVSYRLEELEKKVDKTNIEERLLRLEMWKDEEQKSKA